MEVRNCPECGRLFNYIRTNLCPVCIKEAEEDFQKIRGYLRNNPNISIIELSEDTEVSEEKIIQWIREGRLEAKGLKESPLKCSQCGASIDSGTHCSKCKEKLRSELSKVGSELQSDLDRERDRPKFHSKRD